MELVEKSAPDRRKATPRGRVLLSGKVVFDNGDHSHDCVIRDMTDEGARIKLTSSIPLPQKIYLIEFKKGVALQAQVTWSKPPEFGLKFSKSISLKEESADPFKKGLRRLWLERVAR